jgi:multidrug efflux system membrane fusion protein
MTRLARVIVLFVAALAWSGCSERAGGAPAERKPGATTFPVEVATVEERPVEYAVAAVGAVEAFEAVEVTARVAGAVEKVLFREGDVLKEGQVLVEIEPARYQLTTRQSRASLDRVLAQKADAERGLKRREAMSAEGVASVEEVETFRTRLDTAKAEEAQARASLALAQLNLRDAFVKAPVAGTVEERRVVTGEYVQPGSVIAIIVRKEPMLLRFKVAEHEAANLKKEMPVTFSIRERSGKLDARIKHIGERADSEGRMVTVVADITSAVADLRPGSFAEVLVPIGDARPAPVIPQAAVRPSEKGFLCYVVEDGVAKERVVKLGLRTPDGLVEVRSGIKAGEKLVVRGAEALRDGAAVKEQAAAPQDHKPAPAEGKPSLPPSSAPSGVRSAG